MGNMTIKDFRDKLNKQKSQINLVLPKHLNLDRVIRIIQTTVNNNPKLLACKPETVMGAIMQASELGLEIGVRAHVYLVPYKDECQFILGYRGMLELIKRSGKVKKIEARCVYENDKFQIVYGLQSTIMHEPVIDGEPGKFKGVYAIAFLNAEHGDIYQFEYLTAFEIQKIKAFSKSSNSNYSPWQTSFEEMARKSAIRRLFKYVPSSPEMESAITLDEQAERGEQDNTFYFDNDEVIVETKNSREQKIMEEIENGK